MKSNTQLNDTYLKSIKPKEKKYYVGDGENLLVEIRPNGKKVFCYIFKSPLTNKRVIISIGEYPLITLKKAREIKNEFKEKLLNGIDPKIEKKENTFISFKKVYDEWYSKKEKQVLVKRAHTIKRYFERFFLPTFGDKDIKKVTRQDMLKALEYFEFERKYEAFGKALGTIGNYINMQYLKNMYHIT